MNLNLNEENVSVTIKYRDLIKMMEECVHTTMKEMSDEQKKAKEQKWLNTKETAEIFGRNTSTINRWKHSGYLPSICIGGKDYFSIEEINKKMVS